MTTDFTPSHHHMITVIGGGLTGKMMALALSHSGFDVALIAPVPKADKNAGDKIDRRSTTIHHAGTKMLDALGLTQGLRAEMAPISQIKVAVGAAKPYRSDWLLQWSSAPDIMAHVVENHLLDKVLDDAIAASKAPIIVIDDSVSAYHETSDYALIETAAGAQISTNLIIACDGAKSQMRAMAGITPRIEETGQRAIVTTITTDYGHDDTAYQRFLETGPIALMPLQDKCLSLVWSTSTAQADTLLAYDDVQFSEALQTHFGDELGTISCTEPRGAFALRPQFNRTLSKGRLILAGDAAHAIHPLAGMGYNLALADAAILLDLLQSAHATGLMPDHPSITTAYRNRRMGEIIALSAVTSQLNKLLSRPRGPLSEMMAMGMMMIDKTPLKKRLCDIAMGGKLSSAPLLKGQLR